MSQPRLIHRQTTHIPRNPLLVQPRQLCFLRRAAAGPAAVAAGGAQALLALWLGATLRARLELHLPLLGAPRAQRGRQWQSSGT